MEALPDNPFQKQNLAQVWNRDKEKWRETCFSKKNGKYLLDALLESVILMMLANIEKS